MSSNIWLVHDRTGYFWLGQVISRWVTL